MAEYIDLKKLLAKIDEAFFETDPDGKEQIGVLKCRAIIREIPAADVAPVVRCKDCLYWNGAIGFCHQNSQYYNGGESWDIYQPDDFCSRGERRG